MSDFERAMKSILAIAVQNGFDPEEVRRSIEESDDSVLTIDDVPTTYIGIYERNIRKNAGAFHPDRLPEIHQDVLRWAEGQCAWLDEVAAGDGGAGSTSFGLRLVGVLGAGKTSQAKLAEHHLGRHQARNGRRLNSRFVTHHKFCGDTNFDHKDWEKRLEIYQALDLMVIDDFGAYPHHLDHARYCTSRLVEVRTQMKLPTIYTTNLVPVRGPNRWEEEDKNNVYEQALADFVDMRTVDRYQTARLVTMDNVNWRIKNKLGRPL